MTMREILFRGKHVLDGRWIEGFYNGVRPDLATMQTKECHRIFSLKSLAYDVVPDTVGQFTGLTDKNGKKIFEGDIVQAKEPDTSYRFGCVWSLQVVVFREGSYGLLEFNKFFKSFRSFALSVTFEVVGNIHDNPELMEGENHG